MAWTARPAPVIGRREATTFPTGNRLNTKWPVHPRPWQTRGKGTRGSETHRRQPPRPAPLTGARGPPAPARTRAAPHESTLVCRRAISPFCPRSDGALLSQALCRCIRERGRRPHTLQEGDVGNTLDEKDVPALTKRKRGTQGDKTALTCVPDRGHAWQKQRQCTVPLNLKACT